MANFYTPVKRQPSKKLLTVTIQTLDAFGQGIATHQGKTIFVTNALPGETVQIQLYEEKKQFAKARIIRYLEQSAERVTPRCAHYGVCGGCQMQHIPATWQLAAKQQALVKQLARETGLDLAHLTPEILQDQPYHYRRRARLAIDTTTKPLQLGFRQANGKQIVNIKQCPILEPSLESLIEPLRAVLNQLQARRALGHLELLAVDSGVVIVLRHVQPLTDTDQQTLINFAMQQQLTLFLHGQSLRCLYGDPMPFYRLDNLRLGFSPLDFIQVNANINQRMIQKIIDWLELTSSDYVLDLYCGMGNISLPVAKRVAQLIGVEGVAALVAKAKENCIVNQLPNQLINAQFVQQDLNLLPSKQHWLNELPFNKVILDPGREGALTIITQIAKMNIEQIIYVSCNPATLARDSKPLVTAGYQLQRIAMLEMFPQTKHLETMVLFTKK